MPAPPPGPQVPGECQNGMKMLVKVFCDAGATTTSKLKLGTGVARASGHAASLHQVQSTHPHKLSSSAGGARSAGAAAAAAVAAAAAAGGLLLL
jgi:hypothetical protein